MNAKGYLAESQLLTERQTLARMRHDLATAERQFGLFTRCEVPKEVHGLRSRIQMAEINRRLEADRLKVAEEELAYLKKQMIIAQCASPRGSGCACWRQPMVAPPR